MTETAMSPVVQEPLFAVERNGVTLPLYQTTTTRGKTAGFQYPCPRLDTPEQRQQVYTFLGQEVIDAAVCGKVRQVLINLVKENTSEDGVFDSETFIKNVSDWSARGETKGELMERRDALFEEMMKYAEQTKSEDLEAAQAARAEFERVTSLIKMINAALESKKRDKTEAAAPEAAA